MNSYVPFLSQHVITSIADTPYVIMVAISVVAGLIGTSISYFIGRFGGGNLLLYIKHRFPNTANEIDSSCKQFELYGASTVLIARLIPICRTYIGFVAGVAKLDYVTYLSSSFIGISLWNSFLIGLGYLLEDQWNTITFLYGQYKNIIISMIVLAILYAITRRRIRHLAKKSEETDQNQ